MHIRAYKLVKIEKSHFTKVIMSVTLTKTSKNTPLLIHHGYYYSIQLIEKVEQKFFGNVNTQEITLAMDDSTQYQIMILLRQEANMKIMLAIHDAQQLVNILKS